jgi:hypothetical protein
MTMPAHQGQTDQVLKIKLASQLLSVRWLQTDAAANGVVGLEVATGYVGQGAPIKITIKDSDGGSAGTLEGEVLQNFFRARHKLDGKAAGKTLFFEAELPKHGLKGRSGGLRVGPVVKIEKPQWLDGKTGKPPEKVSKGASVVLKADLKEGPASGEAVLVVYSKIDADHPPSRLREMQVPYADKKLEFPWIADVKPPTSRLESELCFEILVLGATSGLSAPLPFLDIDFKFSQ